jgi:Flp pilus assembly protein TadD
MSNHISKGETHLQAGEIQDALRCFELAVELLPDDHRAIYLMALSHLKLGQEATALVQFNRALELNPENPNYLSDLAVTKLRLGDKEGAMHDLNRCVELDSKNSYRFALRAFARNGMGDVEGAINDYRKAVELDPEDPIALNNLGMAEESFGYTDSAKKHFALADKMSAKSNFPKDHTIDFSKKKTQSATPIELPLAESIESNAQKNETYWSTIVKVFTEKQQRDEFFQFAKNLFKSEKH